MAVRGIGQPDDSPISKSAMLISTACAAVSKDPIYAATFRDPFAERFAVAISDHAAGVLAGLVLHLRLPITATQIAQAWHLFRARSRR